MYTFVPSLKLHSWQVILEKSNVDNVVLEKSLTNGCNFLYEPFYGSNECGNEVQLNVVFFLLCGQLG